MAEDTEGKDPLQKIIEQPASNKRVLEILGEGRVVTPSELEGKVKVPSDGEVIKKISLPIYGTEQSMRKPSEEELRVAKVRGEFLVRLPSEVEIKSLQQDSSGGVKLKDVKHVPITISNLAKLFPGLLLITGAQECERVQDKYQSGDLLVGTANRTKAASWSRAVEFTEGYNKLQATNDQDARVGKRPARMPTLTEAVMLSLLGVVKPGEEVWTSTEFPLSRKVSQKERDLFAARFVVDKTQEGLTRVSTNTINHGFLSGNVRILTVR